MGQMSFPDIPKNTAGLAVMEEFADSTARTGLVASNLLVDAIKENRRKRSAEIANDTLQAFEEGRTKDASKSLADLASVDPETALGVRQELYVRSKYSKKELADLRERTRLLTARAYDKDPVQFKKNMNALVPGEIEDIKAVYGDKAEDIVKNYHGALQAVNTPGMLSAAHETARGMRDVYYPEGKDQEELDAYREQRAASMAARDKMKMAKDDVAIQARIRADARGQQRIGMEAQKMDINVQKNIAADVKRRLGDEADDPAVLNNAIGNAMRYLRESGNFDASIGAAVNEALPQEKTGGLWQAIFGSDESKSAPSPYDASTPEPNATPEAEAPKTGKPSIDDFFD